MLLSDAKAFASFPREIFGALGRFDTFTAVVGKNFAGGTDGDTINTVSSLEFGVGWTLWKGAGKTQPISIKDRSRGAFRNCF
jgi:hypothetical protein